jgi:hypothetical protein
MSERKVLICCYKKSERRRRIKVFKVCVVNPLTIQFENQEKEETTRERERWENEGKSM